MDALNICLVGVALTAVCSLWGWLAVNIVKTNAKVVELEQRMNDKDHQCDDRLDTINALEKKIDAVDTKVAKVAEDTAFIRGKLEVAL